VAWNYGKITNPQKENANPKENCPQSASNNGVSSQRHANILPKSGLKAHQFLDFSNMIRNSSRGLRHIFATLHCAAADGLLFFLFQQPGQFSDCADLKCDLFPHLRNLHCYLQTSLFFTSCYAAKGTSRFAEHRN
jgi:hypothetical protein